MAEKGKASKCVIDLLWRAHICGSMEMEREKKRPTAAVKEMAQKAISNFNRIQARGYGKEWDRKVLSQFVKDAKGMLEAAGFKAA